MQMKDQWKGPTKWKVVAGVGTAAALGFAGIALAGPADSPSAPGPITLQRQVVTGESLAPSTTVWVTTTTGERLSLLTDTNLPVTTTTDYDEIGDSLDDSSPDNLDMATDDSSPDSSPGMATDDSSPDDLDMATDDASPDSPDMTTDDSSPDSPDMTPDDASDSIDAADSSIDS